MIKELGKKLDKSGCAVKKHFFSYFVLETRVSSSNPDLSVISFLKKP
jgi:hypothetical protein